jgi:uncharacterized repeat protein (TIGR03803 family)
MKMQYLRMVNEHILALLMRLLLAAVLVLPAFGAQAGVVFTNFYSFTGGNDGGSPEAGLVQGSDGNFYGTTSHGGTNGDGTVFKISTNGALTSLYSFTGGNDGAYPYAGLVQGSDGNFYGTTSGGGTNGDGTVFQISTNRALTSLYSFTGGNDGGEPYAGLVQGSDGNFYSTTSGGGTNGDGTVFKISTNRALTSLYSFTGGNDGSSPNGLVQGSDGNFYGTTYNGGTSNLGTVFKISTNRALTSLYSFTGSNDGANPDAGLVQGSDGDFYGTTQQGGTNGYGTVFKISTNRALTSLYSFTLGNDGGYPDAGLVQGSDGNFYGTTEYGGTNTLGTVFKISTNGVLISLYSFNGGSDGANPNAGLVQGSDGNFYGTTSTGGEGEAGTVFRLTVVQLPQLTINLSGTNVILTWPPGPTNWTLQSTTNLVLPVWTAVSPASVVVNGQNTVTNPISGTQRFYRLSLLAIPSGMALIPAGSFTMGNSIGDSDIVDAIPANVYVSAFYMDTNLVSLSQWQGVYSYATSDGYTFNNVGADKATNTPVESVDWYDCVKWSNARSQQAGLTPVYYTDAGMMQVFTNGDDGTTVYANWAANGYRLPTEAEWEKAARGGLSGLRFPWGDTISESQANYMGDTNYSYDLGPPGDNAIGMIGGGPYTSPVGSFPANGYGLYDMAGNIFEYCWDWYAAPPYPAGSPYLGGTNPTGPATESLRVIRGGVWVSYATYARCADRDNVSPENADGYVGFRCVKAQ